MSELAFLEHPHCMLDIETLSTRPDAAIVSIGAVHFSFKHGILEEFKVNIDAKSCKDFGLHIEKDTLDWWSRQPKAARQAWMTNPVPLDEGLNKFSEFFGRNNKRLVWCNGASFDYPILRFGYFMIKGEMPWKYYNEMDLRTINQMFNVRNADVRAGSEGHHDALEDAKAQALHLISIFDDK